MRKTIIILTLITFLMGGCGNRHAKITDNKLVGEQNSVFAEQQQTIEQLDENDDNEVNLIDANGVKYELIMNDFFFENKILKPNAALLLSDKKEVKADAEMFLAERRVYHKCGYHYRILFWTNTDSLFGFKSVNEECEVFGYKHDEAKKKLAYYVNLLETAPTHYIYSLEIPVSMKPSEVRKKLKDTKLQLFFIDGKLIRFPNIYFSYRYTQFVGKDADWIETVHSKECEESATKKIKELVDKVKSKYLVVNDLDIDFRGNGTFKDSVYIDVFVNLIFEAGTNLSNVVTFLERKGAKIEKQNIPSSYQVQVVDTSANIEDIKDKLKPYQFIRGITEYTGNPKRNTLR